MQFMECEVRKIPDEVLQTMEKNIIDRFTDRLKQLIFEDNRISKTETLYIDMNMNNAIETYEKPYS